MLGVAIGGLDVVSRRWDMRILWGFLNGDGVEYGIHVIKSTHMRYRTSRSHF
jgi:hypothetical protein